MCSVGGLDGGGVAIYASHYGTPTGWAYWMCMASAPIFLATGCLTLITVCQGEDTINRHDYNPEMMFETMPTADKQPLVSVPPPQTRFKDPPMMEYPNPLFEKGPHSPLEKQPPTNGAPMEEKPYMPLSERY